MSERAEAALEFLIHKVNALEAHLAAIKAAREAMYCWPGEGDEWGGWDYKATQDLLDAIDRTSDGT